MSKPSPALGGASVEGLKAAWRGGKASYPQAGAAPSREPAPAWHREDTRQMSGSLPPTCTPLLAFRNPCYLL